MGAQSKKPEDNWRLDMLIVYAALFAALVLTIMCASGCSPKIYKEIVEKEKIVYRDSTAWRDTTIYAPIPLESGQAVVAVGDTARRETSVARAEAWVDSLGHLNLNLENKRTSVPVVAKIPSRFIYTNVTQNKAEILTKVVEVDKPLSWWKSFKLGAFWWLCGAVMLCLLWIFRKPLLKIIVP